MFSSQLTQLMTWACLAGLLSATVAVTLFRYPSRSRSESAVLDVANPFVDLGALSAGEEREVMFWIVNEGSRRLVINEVVNACNCDEPLPETTVIPPGQAREMIVRIDPRFVTGAIEKSTSFTTNDPAQPRFDLTVRAFVPAGERLHRSDRDQRQKVSVLMPRR